jgi:hypothetical protein
MPIYSSENLLDQKMKAVMSELGHNAERARVVCRCKSADEANEKAKRAGMGERWFKPDCCMETNESAAINLLVNDVEMAICVDGKNFLAIDSDIRDRLLR